MTETDILRDMLKEKDAEIAKLKAELEAALAREREDGQ